MTIFVCCVIMLIWRLAGRLEVQRSCVECMHIQNGAEIDLAANAGNYSGARVDALYGNFCFVALLLGREVDLVQNDDI
jgi:hypothetical protein